MLTLKKKADEPVEAVCKIDMLIDGEEVAAGAVVELKPRDFRYLYHFGRVLPASKENVDAVQKAVAIRNETNARRAADTDDLVSAKAKLARAEAELATFKGKK
jgi:hypothetical protein